MGVCAVNILYFWGGVCSVNILHLWAYPNGFSPPIAECLAFDWFRVRSQVLDDFTYPLSAHHAFQGHQKNNLIVFFFIVWPGLLHKSYTWSIAWLIVQISLYIWIFAQILMERGRGEVRGHRIWPSSYHHNLLHFYFQQKHCAQQDRPVACCVVIPSHQWLHTPPTNTILLLNSHTSSILTNQQNDDEK